MKTTLSYARPLTFAAAFFLAGCDLGQIGKGLDEPVQDATRSLERAIGELTRNSTQWQATLQTLESDLIAQGQRTLANEVQSLIARGTALVTLSSMCAVDFLPRQLKEALKGLLAAARGEPKPPPVPHFCSVDPPSVDLGLAPIERPTTLNVYGFNLKPSNVEATVVSASGQEQRPGAGLFNVATDYMATFNIRNFPFEHTSRYIRFTLPDGEFKAVGISQLPGCGDIDQACCATGRPCKNGTGCLAGRCKACPPAYVPPKPRTELYFREEKFDGNNCLGVNNVHRFGGRCHPGFIRARCVATIKETNSGSTSCEEVGGAGWAATTPTTAHARSGSDQMPTAFTESFVELRFSNS